MERLKLINYQNFQPRLYQENIAETASKRNTLCILPTGMGKTFVAVLVAAKRLEEHPESNMLMLAPTRPLVNQHLKVFKKVFKLEENQFLALTGKIRPEKRKDLYSSAKLIFATPQLIENDLNSGILKLENTSLLVVDECHRSVGKYAYPFVVNAYGKQCKYPLILGLTASPGGSKEKINEICQNLFIEAVEIRSETDEDVAAFVHEIEREWIYVDLPEEFQKIKVLLEESLKENLFWLRDHNYLQTLKPSKKLLLLLQERITEKYTEGPKNYSLFWGMIKVIEAIKIEHALELLETQGISPLYEYLKKIEASKRMTDKRLVKDPRIREAMKITEKLKENLIEHPKLEKLKYIVKDLTKTKPNVKIIVFANYRSTVDKINEVLRKNGIKSEILIGQAVKEKRGLTQQQQIETLRRFANNEFNALIGTSISEEGLSVPDVDYVIFYEPVASEIRTIQRRGRTGRTAPGKVLFLVTKDTRDEAYMWSAYHKEKKMKGILYDMKEKGLKIRRIKQEKIKKTLLDWVK